MSTQLRLLIASKRGIMLIGGLGLMIAGAFLIPPWHFERRHDNNAQPAGLAELAGSEGPEWTELSKSLSIYHDDGVGASERKFVRPNNDSFLGLGGHEAVWNPDTQTLIKEGPFRATYNYVHPDGIFGGFGHVIFDVIPYWFGGTERGDEGTTVFQRVTGSDFGNTSTTKKLASVAVAITAVTVIGRVLLRRYRRWRTSTNDNGPIAAQNPSAR